MCSKLQNKYKIGVVVNDPSPDTETRLKKVLACDSVTAVSTGGCPDRAIGENITSNLLACEELTVKHSCNLIFVLSGGVSTNMDFSRELVDYSIFCLDVAGGEALPSKGGAGVAQSDVLLINKTDLAETMGVSLEVMVSSAQEVRGGRGTVILTQGRNGVGINAVIEQIESVYHLNAF